MNLTTSSNRDRAVLFDGDCGMCSAFVRFVLAHSTDDAVVFIALKSERGQQILSDFGIDTNDTDSIVFVADGRAWVYSSAILEIARHFRFPWRAVRAFVVIPQGLRDVAYRVVARYRKKLFPPPIECALLPPSQRSRIFID